MYKPRSGVQPRPHANLPEFKAARTPAGADMGREISVGNWKDQPNLMLHGKAPGSHPSSPNGPRSPSGGAPAVGTGGKVGPIPNS